MSRWTGFDFVLPQQLFALKKFFKETKLSDISETTNFMKLVKAIVKSFCIVL